MFSLRYIFLLLILFILSGCVIPGQNFFKNDPFTGGVDQSTSILLNIPIPSGLQYYPSHSKILGGTRKEGLEIWRGYVDQITVSTQLYSNLRQQGWQIRLLQRDKDRAAYVYEKKSELAAIVFLKQGALTIIQIWVGPKLEDGTIITSQEMRSKTEDLNTIPKEESIPENAPADINKMETWGVEEREL